MGDNKLIINLDSIMEVEPNSTICISHRAEYPYEDFNPIIYAIHSNVVEKFSDITFKRFGNDYVVVARNISREKHRFMVSIEGESALYHKRKQYE